MEAKVMKSQEQWPKRWMLLFIKLQTFNLTLTWYQTVDLAFQTKILVIILLVSWVQKGNEWAQNKQLLLYNYKVLYQRRDWLKEKGGNKLRDTKIRQELFVILAVSGYFWSIDGKMQ